MPLRMPSAVANAVKAGCPMKLKCPVKSPATLARLGQQCPVFHRISNEMAQTPSRGRGQAHSSMQQSAAAPPMPMSELVKLCPHMKHVGASVHGPEAVAQPPPVSANFSASSGSSSKFGMPMSGKAAGQCPFHTHPKSAARRGTHTSAAVQEETAPVSDPNGLPPRALLKQIFAEFDKDDDGFVAHDQLSCMVDRVGRRLSPALPTCTRTAHARADTALGDAGARSKPMRRPQELDFLDFAMAASMSPLAERLPRGAAPTAPSTPPTPLPVSAPVLATSEAKMEGAFSSTTEKLQQEGRYRVFQNVNRLAGEFPKAIWRCPSGANVPVVTWCTNDYLGMGQEHVVTQAMHDAIDHMGAGSGGTRNISGTNRGHVELEHELADWHAKEAALVFSSCYVANDALLSALPVLLPNLHVFSDAGNHASIIQGISHGAKMKDGLQKHVFRHNDTDHLEELMAAAPSDAKKLVAFESVYSMSGTVSDIGKTCDVAQKYGATTFIDEVHAVGLYGERGGGVAQQRGIEHRLDIYSGTLGKAVGVFGGYIAGSKALIDALRSIAPGFIFTTSLPPMVTRGALASVRTLKSDYGRDLRAQHQERAAKLKLLLGTAGLPVMPGDSHIVPVLVADPIKCKAASDMLLSRHGIYVQPINYPSVPRGSERLRFTPSPLHTDEMMGQLTEALLDVFELLEMPLAARVGGSSTQYGG